MSDDSYKCPKCGGRFDDPDRCPNCEPESSFAAPTGSAVPMVLKDGWTVDFAFLSEISEAIHKTEYGCDEAVSHEMIEAIILELNRRRLLRICPPNEKGQR